MRESFLLHTCCAPCSIYIISQLNQEFDLTVFYFNPNIFPEEEYLIRYGEIQDFCSRKNIPFIEQTYVPKKWLGFVQGYENELEKGRRCDLCYLYRMKHAAQYASQNKFDWFASSLMMGRQKNTMALHRIGRRLENQYKVKFFDRNFKKQFGNDISNWLAQQMDLYQQEYCGCIFSQK